MQDIHNRTAQVGVVGLGYVGLPLAITAAEQGFPVTGFDIDASKMTRLDSGQSYIGAVSDTNTNSAKASKIVAHISINSGV